VREAVEGEVSAKLSVDALQQIPVERAGDPEGVFIREQQIAFWLDEVVAKKQGVTCSQRAPDADEQLASERWIEIADVGAKKEHHE
jgi:hypothetical protein